MDFTVLSDDYETMKNVILLILSQSIYLGRGVD